MVFIFSFRFNFGGISRDTLLQVQHAGSAEDGHRLAGQEQGPDPEGQSCQQPRQGHTRHTGDCSRHPRARVEYYENLPEF